jgi:hypothetical protein
VRRGATGGDSRGDIELETHSKEETERKTVGRERRGGRQQERDTGEGTERALEQGRETEGETEKKK